MEYSFESIGPALRWIVLAFLLVFAIVAVAVVAGIAALPGWIARRRKHPQAAAINICGWFGLPTGVLWVLAVVWAYLEWPSGSREALSAPAGDINVLQDRIARLEATVSGMEDRRS